MNDGHDYGSLGGYGEEEEDRIQYLGFQLRVCRAWEGGREDVKEIEAKV